MQPDRAQCHVLMVLESVYPHILGSGGAEKQVQTLCRHLPGSVKATVVAPMVRFGPQESYSVVEGTPVYRVAYPKVLLLGGMIMLIKLALYILRHHQQIDVIHSHIANNMSAVCCLMGWLLRIPVVVKLTGLLELEHGILSANTSLENRFKRWLIKRVSVIQTTSRDMESVLYRFGFAKQQVCFLPNAVDTYWFAPAPKQKEALKKTLGATSRQVGVFIGRLVPEKSLDTLLQAWHQAVAADADISMLITGWGPMKEALAQQAKQLGIDHQIKLVGPTDRVADYLKIADFGVLPSTCEGLSNALLEAMASGVPMIGSRVSGTVDMLEDGQSGYLFSPGNVNELADCLKKMLGASQEQRQAMGLRARQTILACAGVDYVVAKLTKLYGINSSKGMAVCVES